jgi:hypothetical protein
MGEGINFFDVMFCIIGIILILFSLYLFADTKKAIKNSIETNGTLEKMENNKYIIVFNTEDGKEIESYSLYNNFLSKSSKVGIFYNKENPDDVRINSFMFLWGVPTLTSIIGIILALMIIPKFMIRNL